MTEADFASVDDYIASQPQAVRGILERVRRAIRTALPEAQETISYKMPSYRLQNGGRISFAGWKKHYSLYLASEGIAAAFKDELSCYHVKKGSLSFPLAEPVPAQLIERIVQFRASEITNREKLQTV